MSSMKKTRRDWSRTPSFSFPKPPLRALPQSPPTRPKCNFPAKLRTRRCAWDLGLGTWWISLALRCDRLLSDSILPATRRWLFPFEGGQASALQSSTREFSVLSAFFAVNPWTHPARPASVAASARWRTASWILAHLYLLCFLSLLESLAARAQSSPGPTQQSTSSITRAAPKRIDSNSSVINNAVKAEPLTPDPALAQARLFLKQGKLSEAEGATRAHLHAHQDSADA